MEFWVEMSDWGEDMFNIASLAHFVYGLGHERSVSLNNLQIIYLT